MNKRVAEFRCEYCPLMDDCPFDGEWEECEINKLIDDYELTITNIEDLQNEYISELEEQAFINSFDLEDLPDNIQEAYEENKGNV